MADVKAGKIERVPLEWAIKGPLKPLWDEFSVPQQTFIKASYGLPLESVEEMKAWAVFNEACEIDDLGYVVKWHEVEYKPKEYDTIVGLIGRRAGKSFITCFMTLYEILLGGHTLAASDDQIVVPYVCYDLPTARKNMRAILTLAKMNPKLVKEIESENRDQIVFRNGITLQPEPPTVKTGRGIAIPVVVMDEVGFWYKMSDNANPDYEVQRSLLYSQSQFKHFKQFIISTPYTEEGLLYDYARAGTDGKHLAAEDDRKREFKDCLVVRCSTAAFENPRMVKLGRSQMQKLYDKDDPSTFIRESLARFVASESNFITGELVDLATDKGVRVRRPEEIEKTGIKPSYVAVMDPAFRHDDFAFGIFHRDGRGHIVQDFIHFWTPDYKKGIKLDPQVILGQIKQWLREYGIPIVYSDQYQLEALQQIAQSFGFAVVGEDFTGMSKAKIYGSFEQLLRTQRIHLLDNSDLRAQLVTLNKKLTALGNVQIAAPQGKKDDLASMTALGCYKALQHYPRMESERKEETLFQQLSRQIQERNKEPVWGSV